MARVKRFIYNSDFMTIAHTGREVLTLNIPSGTTSYNGTKEYTLDIPEQSWARVRASYTGTSGPKQDLACNGYFIIMAYKSGKQIGYYATLTFKKGKLIVKYAVDNLTDSTQVLANAQTVTLTIDFLRQPNT